MDAVDLGPAAAGRSRLGFRAAQVAGVAESLGEGSGVVGRLALPACEVAHGDGRLAQVAQPPDLGRQGAVAVEHEQRVSDETRADALGGVDGRGADRLARVMLGEVKHAGDARYAPVMLAGPFGDASEVAGLRVAARLNAGAERVETVARLAAERERDPPEPAGAYFVPGGVIETVSFRSAPYPSPEELAQYEAIHPGFTDRILSLTERETTHRHGREDKQDDAKIALARRGQIFAFIVVMTLVIGGIIAIITGHSIVGLAGLVVAAATLTGAFVAPSLFRHTNDNEPGAQIDQQAVDADDARTDR